MPIGHKHTKMNARASTREYAASEESHCAMIGSRSDSSCEMRARSRGLARLARRTFSERSAMRNVIVVGGSAMEFEANLSHVHAAKTPDEMGPTRTKATKSTRGSVLSKLLIRWRSFRNDEEDPTFALLK